jgi:hypothetical protein
MRLKHGHGGNFRRLVATATASLGILASVSAVSVTNAPAAPAVAIPTVTCSSNPDIFDTGYDAARGGVLPDGSADANWTVAGGYQGLYYPTGTTPPDQVLRPPAGATFLPAQVGNTTLAPGRPALTASRSGYQPTTFPRPRRTSRAPRPSTTPTGTTSTGSTWRSVDPSAFVLTMNWLVDNDVAAVFVNGVQQTGTGLPQNTDTASPYQYLGYLAGNAASTTLTGSWRTGLNHHHRSDKERLLQRGVRRPGAAERPVPDARGVQYRRRARQPGRPVHRRGGRRLRPLADLSYHDRAAQTSVTGPLAYLPTGSTYTITDAMTAGSPDPLDGLRPDHQLYRHHCRPDRAPVRHRPHLDADGNQSPTSTPATSPTHPRTRRCR